jgi:hypothetical protein
MGKREKLEIPTITFTPVTLLNSTGNSSCTCVGRTATCDYVWTDTAVNPGGGGTGGGGQVSGED